MKQQRFYNCDTNFLRTLNTSMSQHLEIRDPLFKLLPRLTQQ